MGIAQTSFSEAYNKLKPDIIVVLGDRYEIFSAASRCHDCKNSNSSYSWWRNTEGSMDDSYSSLYNKMSSFAFYCYKEYQERVIQLGEDPKEFLM